MDSILSLDSLAIAINAAHERCQRSYVTMLSDARSTGELLLQAKSQLPHGQWTAWLSSNCAFSDRTAQRYMQIASSWDTLQSKTDTVADLGVRMACEMIASEKILDLPNENKTRVVPKPKNQIATHSDIRPGDRVAVIDPESPEHGQELEVSEVVQDAIALVKKGGETYPLLVNQVKVVSSREDIEDIKSSAASDALKSSATNAGSLCKSGEPHKNNNLPLSGKVVSSLPQNMLAETRQRAPQGGGLSQVEITVAALQDILRRILDECGEYLSPELIDEARELL